MKPIHHHLRTYRRRSVFTQYDIADLLGKDVSQISRHETSPVHPQIEIGLLYEILLDKPFSDIFREQKQLIMRRLIKCIPNIIDELRCMNMNEIVNHKIGCLQNVLTTLNDIPNDYE